MSSVRCEPQDWPPQRVTASVERLAPALGEGRILRLRLCNSCRLRSHESPPALFLHIYVDTPSLSAQLATPQLTLYCGAARDNSCIAINTHLDILNIERAQCTCTRFHLSYPLSFGLDDAQGVCERVIVS